MQVDRKGKREGREGSFFTQSVRLFLVARCGCASVLDILLLFLSLSLSGLFVWLPVCVVVVLLILDFEFLDFGILI